MSRLVRLPLGKGYSSKERTSAARVRPARSAMIEALEGRQLLSVAPLAWAGAIPSSHDSSLKLANVVAPLRTTEIPVVTLSATLSNVTPGSILAGKSGTAVLTIANKGNTRAAGSLTVTLSLSQDGTSALAGTAALTSATVNVQIGAHGSTHVKLPFQVPTSLPAGPYFAVAAATFTSTNAATVTTPSLSTGTHKSFTVRQPPQPVTTPSLIGKYAGTVKPDNGGLFGDIVNSVVGKQSLELDITGQSIDALTGTIKIGGHSATGTFAGRLLSNGNFHYELSGSGYDLTISGHVKPDGSAMSGDISGTINDSSLLSLKGKFSATLQTTSAT